MNRTEIDELQQEVDYLNEALLKKEAAWSVILKENSDLRTTVTTLSALITQLHEKLAEKRRDK